MDTLKQILLADLNFLSFIIFAVGVLISTFIFERKLNNIKAELDTKVFNADYGKFRVWVKNKIGFNLEEIKFEIGEDVFFEVMLRKEKIFENSVYKNGEIISFKPYKNFSGEEIIYFLVKDKETGLILEVEVEQIYKKKAKK